MLKVLSMIDTYQINAPCRLLLQLIQVPSSEDVRFLIGMFLGTTETSPAIDECRRRGFELALFSKRHRYDPRLIFDVLKIVKRQGVTVLESHGYKTAVLAWSLRRLTGLPWVAVMHGDTSENKRVALYNKLDLWTARSADRVIAVSTAMGKTLEQRGVPKSRIRVILNAVEPKAFQLEKDGREFRRNCGASSEHLLVGVIARLSPEKGVEVFLQAMKRIVKDVPCVKAVLVGEGQEADRLKAMVKIGGLTSHVHFAGYQTDISSIYSALDLVVIPSHSEGLPNVLLEAFLHRRSAVATAVGGIPEVMQGDLSGWLVPPADPAKLADTMIKALKSPQLRARFGELGAQVVSEKFMPARRAEQFLMMYKELIKSEGLPDRPIMTDAA